ncbi:MAG TPA: hypothetical protein VGC92_13615 [Phenylobacterium sp.]|jgi:hypothetical protein
MTAADTRVAMLAEMRAPTCRLGMAFAAEAERATDAAKKSEFFQLFDRCFFSVRVAIGLELRLERTPAARAEPRDAASDREVLVEREPLDEADPPDRYEAEYDRERDRETERASLPILLRTLEGVVADAAELTGPAPADLLTLRELLARVKAQPATLPAKPANLRNRLVNSGAAATSGPPARRPASNVAEVLAARRATGPPRRV